MNKEELLEMAREAGLFGNVDIHTISSFFNTTLECAAVECEEDPFANHPHIIRTMKTKGD